MAEKKTIDALVSGGQATAGPPLGPALGPLGVNVVAIVNRINDLTKGFAGMKVPVKIAVDVETKEFEVIVGTPTTSALIVSTLKIEKGSGSPKEEKVGDLTLEQVVDIARKKQSQLLAKSLKLAAKEVIGSCVSMGVTINGEDPKKIQTEIDEGKYDSAFENGK
ncbi:MAG: 50S ribosomal protein L11 [Candidatus Bathyarchaeota archaeon]|jgi:large subunit ribosomal protein L11|nr:MAG: 50S ribosomal protein L11 [Candidatus Bathyarchaeota archaeon]